ncbi:MAG: ELWxxDGT repeat protein, partial [Salibacteraceae bacterium]
DGTEGGTQIIKDIKPSFGSPYLGHPVGFKGKLFFFAKDTALGNELWISDGTNSGTHVFKDYFPGKTGFTDYPNRIEEFKQNSKYLFFVGEDNISGRELYRTDGTPQGTKRVLDILPGTGNGVGGLGNSIVFDDKLFFSANSPVSQLFVSSGDSSNTFQSFFPSTPSNPHFPGNFKIFRNKLFYTGRSVSGYDYHIYWISKSSLTSNVLSDNNGQPVKIGNSTLRGFWGDADSIVFFVGQDPNNIGKFELFRTEGTNTTTNMFNEKSNGTIKYTLHDGGIDTFQGHWLARVETKSYGKEPWMIHSPTNAYLLRDIRKGTPDSEFGSSNGILNGEFYFNGTNGFQDMWKTKGDSASTKFIIPTPSLGSISEIRFFPEPFNGFLLGTAFMNSHGRELIRTDGTDPGTYIVKDFNPGGTPANVPFNGRTRILGKINNTAIIRADSNGVGQELWASDGTFAGTHLIKDINPGPQHGVGSAYLKCNGKIFFQANNGQNGTELWVTDGTSNGTNLIKDINPGVSDGVSTVMVCFRDTTYFIGNDGTNGYELWRSSGTSSSTVMVQDINPGSGSSYPEEFEVAGGSLYFTAYSGNNATNDAFQIWKISDANTPALEITKLEKIPNEKPKHLTRFNDKLIFSAYSHKYGREPYISYGDTSTCGTYIIEDINYMSKSSTPAAFTPKGDSMLFWAEDQFFGRELRMISNPKNRKLILENPIHFFACDTNNPAWFKAELCNIIDSMRWQINSGTGWKNISNNTNYNGANTDSLQVTSFSKKIANNQFRLLAYSTEYGIDTSSIVIINVNIIKVLSKTVKNTPCYGANQGYAKVIATGTNLHYEWSSSITKWPNDSNEIFNLHSGNINLSIFDENGCLERTTVNIGSAAKVVPVKTVNQPPICFGDSSGWISFDLSGGTPPYSYSWINSQSTDSVAFNLAAGKYTLEVIDSNNCKNQFESSLTEPNQIKVNVSEEVCQLDTFHFHGHKFWTDSSYVDTLTSFFGCDSVINLTVSFIRYDDSIYLRNDTLYSVFKNADYYNWLNCSTSIIEGTTFTPYYVPTLGYPYQVLFNKDNCTDSSRCLFVPPQQGTNISRGKTNDRFKLYPNPTTGLLTLSFTWQGQFEVTIRDISGKQVAPAKSFNGVYGDLNVTELAKGYYFLHIKHHEYTEVQKFIKQ